MFIALTLIEHGAPAERDVPVRLNQHSAPAGAGNQRTLGGYKHFAPLEQRPFALLEQKIAARCL